MISPSASSVSVDWPSRIDGVVGLLGEREVPEQAGGLVRPRRPGRPSPSGPACRRARPGRVRASRRSRPTTSCDVQPAGLSTMTSPFHVGAWPRSSSGDRRPAARSGCARRRRDGRCVGVPAQGEPGRGRVPAAAERDARRSDVDAALGPGGDLPRAVVVLLEHDGDLGLVGAPHDVDDAFDRSYGGRAPRGRRASTVVQTMPRPPATSRLEPGAAERAGEHRQVAERRAVPQLAGDRARAGCRRSSSRPASAWTSGVVAAYLNEPVSVTSPTYRPRAMSWVSGTPSRPMSSLGEHRGGRGVGVDEMHRAETVLDAW